MLKMIARKPAAKTETCLKFGFVVTQQEQHYCPRCNSLLNAGPNYQPKYCDRCGQKISFAGIRWKQERELGFVRKRGDGSDDKKFLE